MPKMFMLDTALDGDDTAGGAKIAAVEVVVSQLCLN